MDHHHRQLQQNGMPRLGMVGFRPLSFPAFHRPISGIQQPSNQLVRHQHNFLHPPPSQFLNFNNAAADSATVASAPVFSGPQRFYLPLPMVPIDLGIDLASVRGEIDLCKRRYEREVWSVICAKALQSTRSWTTAASAPEGNSGVRNSRKLSENYQQHQQHHQQQQQQHQQQHLIAESAGVDDETSGNIATGAGEAKMGSGQDTGVTVPASRPLRGQPAASTISIATHPPAITDDELTEDSHNGEEGEVFEDSVNANNRLLIKTRTGSSRDSYAAQLKPMLQASSHLHQLQQKHSLHQQQQQQHRRPEQHRQQPQQQHRQQPQQQHRSVRRSERNNGNNCVRKSQVLAWQQLGCCVDKASASTDFFLKQRKKMAVVLPDCNSISSFSGENIEGGSERTEAPAALPFTSRLSSRWSFLQQATNNGNSGQRTMVTEEDKLSSGSAGTMLDESRTFVPIFCGNWTTSETKKTRQQKQEKPELLPPLCGQEHQSLSLPASEPLAFTFQQFPQLQEQKRHPLYSYQQRDQQTFPGIQAP